MDRCIKAEAAALGRTWASDMFREFCASPELRKARGDMPRHIAVYARFFARLGEEFACVEEVAQEALLRKFGAEGLRRQFQPVRFLVGRLGLAWDEGGGEWVIGAMRVDARLRSAAGAPWAEDLAAYRQSLTEGGRGRITPRTERMYVGVAADVLAWSGVGRAAELTEAHVRRYLHGVRGQAASLSRFLTWVTGAGGGVLGKWPERRTRPRERERRLLARAAGLVARPAAATDPGEGRALLAAAISAVHGVPLLHVLTLRVARAIPGPTRVRLWPGEAEVVLTGMLADGYARFASKQGPFAFPGRNGLQPLTPAGVRHHLALWD